MDELVSEIKTRFDGWRNSISGMGSDRDRTLATSFGDETLVSEQEAVALYRFNSVARRIIELLPNEATRQEWSLDDDGVANQLKALGARDKIREGLRWGRLFGRACIYVASSGDGDARTPAPTGPRSVKYLAVYDGRQMSPGPKYTEPGHPNLGKPQYYTLTEVWGGTMQVHESRLILFGGADTPEREWHANGCRDDSVLDPIYEDLRSFGEAWKNVGFMLGDATQAVYKMKGLISRLGAKGAEDVRTRMRFTDMLRGVFRGVVLDLDESFEKHSTNFGGLGDILDREASKLSSATGIPVTLLMGVSPAGMNATGASDIRMWYDHVQSYQAEVVASVVIQLAGMLSTEPVEVSFKSLWQESATERATRQKTIAETDAIRIDTQVLTPEEVALARHGRAEWDAPIVLEEEQLERRRNALDEPPAPKTTTPAV